MTGVLGGQGEGVGTGLAPKNPINERPRFRAVGHRRLVHDELVVGRHRPALGSRPENEVGDTGIGAEVVDGRHQGRVPGVTLLPAVLIRSAMPSGLYARTCSCSQKPSEYVSYC